MNQKRIRHIRKKQSIIYAKHLLLFLITLLTTTLAGTEWMYGRDFFYSEKTLGMEEFWTGFTFSIPFLLALTVHEFGHYFMAKYHKLRVSLPFYIPMWLSFLSIQGSIGTLGAVIRIHNRILTRQQSFDVGFAGPLAGFVVALGVLWYGFTHLPDPSYIFIIHPDYQVYGFDYAQYVYRSDIPNMQMGTNLVFEFFKTFVADTSRLPNNYEIMHYPFLFAGYLALFFTALNLIPIGQLDGGHILFGLVGERRHQVISVVLFALFIFYAGLGIFSPHDSIEDLALYAPLYIGFLYVVFSRVFRSRMNILLLALGVFTLQFVTKFIFIDVEGYSGWLAFGLVLGRVLGVYHPPVRYSKPLDWRRKLIGWLMLLIFIMCFTPKPFIIG